MTIDKNVWDKVGGIVEATFVNIVQKKKAPQDFDLAELKSICYLECGYLLSKYKPGAWAVTTYVYEYLEKRVIARAYKELEEAKCMQQMLIDDEEEIAYDEYKSLAAHLEDKDLHERVMETAIENGLGDVASLLGTHTQAEIAKKLGITQPAVA